ncbi:PAP2 family protein [Pandoraea pneumonica]|uniref:PAP2 family protein n=1 Tax=Pandoraea pneumonica TaxID=2508299 RepID=A0A5E4RIE8_9BURK|nr:phosphatase PAP2 family protein [Pandoraea pneumonica]VVD62905.1 PAP2 family protein [Pandoraea pneumonica]
MSEKAGRIYAFTWLVNTALALADWTWSNQIGLQIDGSYLEWVALRCLISLGIAAALRAAANSPWCARTTRAVLYRSASAGIMWIATLAVFASLALIFQYLTVTLSFPEIASTLVAADSRLGFDWPAAYYWVKARPWLDAIFSMAYQSGIFQLALIPFILIVTNNVRYYAEFVIQFIVASAFVIFIATPFPAESAYVHFNIRDLGTASTVADFWLFRSGRFHELTLQSMQGLVSLPSFHTVLAVLFAYAVRHVRRVFPIFILLNIVMIASTPTHGGHYIWDVIAGLAIAVAAVWSSHRLMKAFGGEIQFRDRHAVKVGVLPAVRTTDLN